MPLHPPQSTLFPYTTLFRSQLSPTRSMPPELLVGALAVAALIAYALLGGADFGGGVWDLFASGPRRAEQREADRKSTRLNSSHLVISYAVFCLKKKMKN